MLGTELLHEHRLGVPAGLLGLVEAVELVEQDAQVAQVHGGQDVVVAQDAPVRLVDPPLDLLGFAALSPFQNSTCA